MMIVDTKTAKQVFSCGYQEMNYPLVTHNMFSNYQRDTGCCFLSMPSLSSIDAHKALNVVKKIAGSMLDGNLSIMPSDFNDVNEGFCVFIPVLIECKDYNGKIADAHGLRVEIHDIFVGHELAQCDVVILDRLALLTKTVEYSSALNPFLLYINGRNVDALPVDDNGNVKTGVWRKTVEDMNVVVYTERFGEAFVRVVLSRQIDRCNAWKISTYIGMQSFMIEVEPRDVYNTLRFGSRWQTTTERKTARDVIHTLLACYRLVKFAEQRLRWLMGNEAVDELFTPVCVVEGRTAYRRALCSDLMIVTGAECDDDEVVDVVKAVAAERLGLVKDYKTVVSQSDAKCVQVGVDGVLVKLHGEKYTFVDTKWARVAVDEYVQRGLYAPWLIERAKQIRRDAEVVQRATMELVG